MIRSGCLRLNFLEQNVYFARYGNACVSLETTNLTNKIGTIFLLCEMNTFGVSFSLTQSRDFRQINTRMWVGLPGSEHSVGEEP